MLNKFFGKKKKEDYFLEFEVKNNDKVSTNNPKIKTQSTANYDQPEWVKAIKNYSDQGTSEASQQEANNGGFAGKYVTNNVPMSRRRPGPSLNKFKDIASKIDA